MKKCSDCNVEMIEDTNIHTDYVGGYSFEEEIYLTVETDEMVTGLFGNQRKKSYTKRIKARVCPKCGKVELFINLEEKD